MPLPKYVWDNELKKVKSEHQELVSAMIAAVNELLYLIPYFAEN